MKKHLTIQIKKNTFTQSSEGTPSHGEKPQQVEEKEDEAEIEGNTVPPSSSSSSSSSSSVFQKKQQQQQQTKPATVSTSSSLNMAPIITMKKPNLHVQTSHIHRTETGSTSKKSTQSPIKRKSKKKESPLIKNLEKLKVPAKKQDPRDFELTMSGTFRLEDIEVTPYGFTPSSVTSTSSSNFSASTPFTPDAAPLSFPANQSPGTKSPAPLSSKDITYDSLTISRKSRLGSGASANVIRVTHNGKPYALKIIPLYTGDVNPSLIVREIRSLFASINCPYIIRFYEAYSREGSIKILLEYMDCGSLDDVYRIAGKIPEDVLSEIAYQLLLGLKYLGEHRIIHRDIKPSNVLLNKEGAVKISDFGMSKQLCASVQVFKTFQGTFMYMSPERLKGEDHSFDSDIWSLGLTIAECAIGKFPYNLEKFGLWEVLQYINDNGLDIKSGVDVSKELYDFISACIMNNPKERKSANQLLNFPFITKHNPNVTPETFKPTKTVQWIHDVYLKKKKELHMKERARKSSLAKSSKKLNETTTSSSSSSSHLETSRSRNILSSSPSSSKSAMNGDKTQKIYTSKLISPQNLKQTLIDEGEYHEEDDVD